MRTPRGTGQQGGPQASTACGRGQVEARPCSCRPWPYPQVRSGPVRSLQGPAHLPTLTCTGNTGSAPTPDANHLHLMAPWVGGYQSLPSIRPHCHSNPPGPGGLGRGSLPSPTGGLLRQGGGRKESHRHWLFGCSEMGLLPHFVLVCLRSPGRGGSPLFHGHAAAGTDEVMSSPQV